MIRSVIRCPNDMVMVFDEKGEQIPEYQGLYPKVRERLIREAPPFTVFGCWQNYQTDIQTVSREQW
ncbi:MAG: hypothetical protein V1849_02725 [Chloroflexota bacterium]